MGIMQKLLQDALSDDDVKDIAQALSEEVYRNLSAGMTKGDVIRQLVGWAARHEQFPELIEAVAEKNSRQVDARFGELEQQIERAVDDETATLAQLYTAAHGGVRLPGDEPLESAHDLVESIRDADNPLESIVGVRTWIKEARRSATRRTRAGAQARAQISALDIRLRPSDIGDKTFTLNAWFYPECYPAKPGQNFQGVPVHSSSTAETLAEIRNSIRTAIRRAATMFPDTSDIIVGFMVPEKTLLAEEALDFDEWSFEGGNALLGSLYPVVLRVFERSGTSRARWNSRWEQLSKPGARPSDVWVKCNRQLQPSQMVAMLELAGDEVVLFVSRQPAAHDTAKVLKSALEAGIPVALWSREPCIDHARNPEAGHPCAGDKFQGGVGDLLKGSLFEDFPARIRILRNEAILEGDTHFCHKVTLLWDDPRRLPPDDEEHEEGSPYRPPARSSAPVGAPS